MKTDLPPCPAHPPRKRRHLQDPGRTPDLWLRLWIEDESLPARERGRADEERRRRRDAEKEATGVVGLIAGSRGATGLQTRVMVDVVQGMPGMKCALASEGLASVLVQRGRRPSYPLAALMGLGLAVIVDAGNALSESGPVIVRQATAVVVLPPEQRLPASADRAGPVWDVARYARHRKLPVTAIMPDGTILRPDGTMSLPDGTTKQGAWA